MGTYLSVLRQSAFLPTPPITEKNIPDQAGKVFIITGANTGVGYHVACVLYAANATVYIAARTESKATSAIQSIKAAHPTTTSTTSSKESREIGRGSLHFLHLDLSDLSTIKASAEDFLRREDRLDVLVNNAGVMVPGPGSHGAQGHELQYVTNVLGPFLFTKLLLPVLRRTAAATAATPMEGGAGGGGGGLGVGPGAGAIRVCWAASTGADLFTPKGGVTFGEDGAPVVTGQGGGPKEYGVSKCANYFLAYEFGKRFGDADGVLHNSFNPGNLKTELQRHARSKFGTAVFAILDTMLYPAVYGAYTELYAALSPELTIEGGSQGAYIWPWGRVGSLRADVRAECGKPGGKSELLYEWCERETGKWA